MSSPTQRSLKEMRKRGYTCQVTEKWNPFAKVRQDLFGFCDILCIRPGEILAVQSTTAGNALARLKKIKAEPKAWRWLEAGGTIKVQGWKKCGKRGIAPGKWVVVEINYPERRALPPRRCD